MNAQKLKDSEILIDAKKILIKSPELQFIEYAIDDVINGSDDQKQYLISWIDNMLDEYNSLESWISDNHPSFHRSQENIQALRLKWLDWMIQECEKDGN